jgi:hypothetical protein
VVLVTDSALIVIVGLAPGFSTHHLYVHILDRVVWYGLLLLFPVSCLAIGLSWYHARENPDCSHDALDELVELLLGVGGSIGIVIGGICWLWLMPV